MDKQKAETVDTGVRVYAAFDQSGKRRTGWYSTPTEAQLFCKIRWYVDEVQIHGKPRKQAAS